MREHERRRKIKRGRRPLLLSLLLLIGGVGGGGGCYWDQAAASNAFMFAFQHYYPYAFLYPADLAYPSVWSAAWLYSDW